MAKWTDYTTDTNPTDTDEVMTLDTDKTPKANKRVTLSTLADYFLDKLASKVFAKLETQNKTVIGAINELNNPTFSEAETRNNINSGESIPTLFGKVKKWFTDLNTLIKLVGSADISGIGNGTVTGALLTLNSKQSKTVSVSNATSIQELVNSATGGTNILFHLAGAGYTGSDLPNDGKYKYGSGIVFCRNSGSCKIVLIPEELKPVWKMSTWTKWRDFANNIVD